MKKYKETLKYLYEQLPMFQRVGAAAYKADLRTTEELCATLQNPEQRFPSIHIAGTNGKGSTAHLLASVLMEAGFKTGLYTSPHLVDFRERIRIDGRMIPGAGVVAFVEKYQPAIQRIKPSFFEISFAMAMDYFAAEGVDIALIETGMGGRLDSTNVVRSVLSVITNISMDHMQFLGDSLSAIAREKAGIIKPSVPVLIGRRQSETEAVFQSYARKQAAPLYFTDELLSLERVGEGRYRISQGVWQALEFEVPLYGAYQQENVATVLAALHIMGQQEPYAVLAEEACWREGFRRVLKNTSFQGRWQELGKYPRIICDTGHNEEGLAFIAQQLTKEKYSALHVVLGMVNDKAIDRLLSMLPSQASYYFCKADIPRGLDASVLQKHAEAAGLHGDVYPSVRRAYAAALQAAAAEDLVFVGGSTFVVAEVLAAEAH